MPCANVHLVLANRVLQSWEAVPSTAPVPQGEPPVRTAFFTGALAPDAGFVPGTRRQMSELAHYVMPGDLARTLLRQARTVEEQAFALGWATHVLADVELHPLVGRAVGERLFGDRNRRVDTADDVETHVSVEVGLDMAVGDAEGDRLPVAPARAWADAPSSRYLARALESTYGFGWQPAPLLRDQKRSGWMMRHWPRTLALLGPPGGPPEGSPAVSRTGAAADSPPRRSLWARWFLEGARRLAPEGSPHRGFFGPVAPERWLMEAVAERTEGFAARFQTVLESGLAMLGNRNLETGEETPEGSGHAATDRSWDALRQAQAASKGQPGREGPKVKG